METNLAYEGGGNNAYGDVINGRYGTLIDLYTASDGGAYDYGWYFYSYVSRGDTYYPEQPVSMPGYNGYGRGAYGYLYNYCAAMGGDSICLR